MEINSRKKSLCCQSDHLSDVVHHTAAQQLVEAQETSEKEGPFRSGCILFLLLSVRLVLYCQNIDQGKGLDPQRGLFLQLSVIQLSRYLTLGIRILRTLEGSIAK